MPQSNVLYPTKKLPTWLRQTRTYTELALVEHGSSPSRFPVNIGLQESQVNSFSPINRPYWPMSKAES